MNTEFENFYKIVDWDTQLFGYKVVKITKDNLDAETLKRLLEHLRVESVTLVYWFAKNKNDIALENYGELVDQKIFFEMKTQVTTHRNSNVVPITKNTLDKQIIALALQSGVFSRYKIDKNFRNNEYNKLYTKWIKSTIQENSSDEVFVYRENNDSIGLITVKKDSTSNKLEIGLLAVHEDFRGKGIAQMLISEANYVADQHSLPVVSVATQSRNVPACSLYKKIGFKMIKSQYVYHFWLSSI